MTRIEIDEKRQIHITYIRIHAASSADSCKLDFNRIFGGKIEDRFTKIMSVQNET